MANESVNIQSVKDGVGAHWAQETTLSEIKKIQDDLLSELSRGNSDSDTKSSTANDYLEQIASASAGGNEILMRSSASLRSDMQSFQASLEAIPDGINEKLGKSIPDNAPAVEKFGVSIKALKKPLEVFKKGIVGISTYLAGILVGALHKQFESSVLVYKASIDLGTRLNDLGETVDDSAGVLTRSVSGLGLSLDSVTNTFIGSGKAIEKFGADAFISTAKTIKGAGTNLGKTFEETTEYLGDYLERQRLFGALENMSKQQAAQQAAQSLKDTTAFAQQLRMSTVDLEKQRQSQAEQADRALALSLVPESMRDGVNSFLTSLDSVDSELANGFTAAIQDTASFAGSNFAMNYRKMGMGQVVDKMIQDAEAIKAGTLKADANYLKQFAKQNFSNINEQHINLLKQRGKVDQAAAESAKKLNQFANMADKSAKELRVSSEAVARAKISDIMNTLGSAIDNVVASFTNTSGIWGALMTSVDYLSDSVSTFVNGKFFQTLGKMLGNLFNTLSVVLGPVIKLLAFAFGGLVDLLSLVLVPTFEFVSDTLEFIAKGWQLIGDAFSSIDITPFLDKFGESLVNIGVWINGLIDWWQPMFDLLGDSFNRLPDTINTVVEWFTALPNLLGEIFSSIGTTIRQYLGDALNNVVDILLDAGDGIMSFIQSIPGFGLSEEEEAAQEKERKERKARTFARRAGIKNEIDTMSDEQSELRNTSRGQMLRRNVARIESAAPTPKQAEIQQTAKKNEQVNIESKDTMGNIEKILTDQNKLIELLAGINTGQYKEQQKQNRKSSFYQ